MDTGHMVLKLEQDELEVFQALDSRVEGYREGIEAAKRTMLAQIIKSRNNGAPNGTIAQSEHATPGHAPSDAGQPLQKVQSAGGPDQPEWAGIPASNGPPNSTGDNARNPGTDEGYELQPIELAADTTFTGSNFPAVFPVAGAAEPWLESAFAGDDGSAKHGGGDSTIAESIPENGRS